MKQSNHLFEVINEYIHAKHAYRDKVRHHSFTLFVTAMSHGKAQIMPSVVDTLDLHPHALGIQFHLWQKIVMRECDIGDVSLVKLK